MKNILKTLMLCCLSYTLIGQLSDGSIAPDFTLEDIDGNTHTLYDYLDDGYSVILDMSATWCGPCWNYHSSGVLEDIWEDYGPPGSDMVMVFHIEADPGTSEPCIFGSSGCTGGSIGDWTAGVDYPILNPNSSDANAINNDYNILFFPTIYAISPTGLTYEVGQPSYSGWENWILGSFQMSADYTVVNDGCDGGAIDLETNAGFGNLDFEWSNGETTEDISGLSTDDYYVTITDNNNYEIYLGPIEVSGGDLVEISLVESENPDCNASYTGMIEVEAFGGSNDFIFEWSSGDEGPILFDALAGDYELTVTDLNTDCSYEAFYELEDPDELEMEVDIEQPNCDNADDNGSIDVDIDGGTFPYYYFVNGNEYDSEYIILEPGEYELEVFDDNNCYLTTEFTIQEVMVPLSSPLVNGNLTCTNTTVLLSGTSSSTGDNISYSWFDENGTFLGDNIDLLVDTAGIYTLEVYDELSDCSSNSNIEVVQNVNQPTAEIGPTVDLNCLNETSMITPTLTNIENASIEWVSTGNILTYNDDNSIIVDQAGSYQIIVSDTISGCVATSSINIMSTGIPEVNWFGNTEFCNGEETIVCADHLSNESVNWYLDGMLIGSEDCINLSNAGNLQVEIIDSNTNCANSENINITNYQAPEISLPSNYNICEGEQFQFCLEPNENETIEWDINGIISTESCVEINQNIAGITTIAITITNTLNGCITSDEITLNTISLPQSNWSGTPEVCDGGITTLCAELSNGESATWLIDGEILNSNCIDVGASSLVSLEVSNNEGCSTQETFMIDEIPSPNVNWSGATTFCEGSSTTICLEHDATETIIYEINGEIISSESCITIEETSTINVVVENSAGCTSNQSIDVNMEAAPQIEDIADLYFCQGSMSQICLNIPEGQTLNWYVDGILVSTESCLELEGSHMVMVELVNNMSSCSNTKQFQTIELFNPSISINEPNIIDCINPTSTIEIETSSNINLEIYNESGDLIGTTPSVEVSSAGVYSILATDENGCVTSSNVEIIADVEALPNTDFSFEQLEFEVSFQDLTTGNVVNSLWDFGDGNTSMEQNPTHIYQEAGIYIVCLDSENECGIHTTCEEVSIIAPLQIISNKQDISCFGENDGSINLDISGGLAPYKISWDNYPEFEDQPALEDLGPGEYTFTLTDDNGFETIETITILEPTEIMVQADIISTISSENNGQISLDIQGGTPEYFIQWDNGEIGQTIQNLSQGTYTVVIRDQNDCTTTEVYTITGTTNIHDIESLNYFKVAPNPSNSITTVSINFDKQKQGTISVLTLNGKELQQYPFNNNSISKQIDVQDLASGVYFIRVKVQNNWMVEKLVVMK